MGWMASAKPRPLYPRERDQVPILVEARWAPRAVWTAAENVALTGIRFPDRPARSESLYWLTYPYPHLRLLWRLLLGGGGGEVGFSWKGCGCFVLMVMGISDVRVLSLVASKCVCRILRVFRSSASVKIVEWRTAVRQYLMGDCEEGALSGWPTNSCVLPVLWRQFVHWP